MADKGVKILIAEDERPMARAMQLKLSSSGYEVDVAGDGEEALQKLKEKHYDLLLLDLMMPKVGGFEVLEGMNAAKITTTVLIMSNLNQEEDINKAKGLGAKDFFVKSDIPLSEVLKQVERALS